MRVVHKTRLVPGVQFKVNSPPPLLCVDTTTERGPTLNFEHETHGNLLVIRPAFPRLDSIAAPEFRQYVNDLAAEQNAPIVIDLVNVEFVDSSGLGAIIGCYKATQGSGGLSLCNVDESVKEVFTLTHMDRIFEIHDDFDSCLSKLAA